MLQIRHGVFETNSSSSHSIAIRKESGHYTKEEIIKSVYCVWDNRLRLWDHDLEFGRAPFKPCADFYSKWKYALAAVGNNDEQRAELEDLMREYFPNLTIEYPRERNWRTEEYETFYGSIDHQSIGVLQSCLATKQISLREFITNKKYVIFVDGDEYCVTEKLFNSGLLKLEDFEDPGVDVEDLSFIETID